MLTFEPNASKVDRMEIGLMHLQTGEGVQWEPIAGDESMGNASDDEDGEVHGSSATAPTNLFLRTVGKTTRNTTSKTTVVGQRRTCGRSTPSSTLMVEIMLYLFVFCFRISLVIRLYSCKFHRLRSST